MTFTFDFEGKTYAVGVDQWCLGFKLSEPSIGNNYYTAEDYQFIRQSLGCAKTRAFWQAFEKAFDANDARWYDWTHTTN